MVIFAVLNRNVLIFLLNSTISSVVRSRAVQPCGAEMILPHLL